jgi:hypothetical protein
MVTAPIRMSPTGFKAFVEVLSQPACPVPEMVELFQRTGRGSPGRQKPRVSRGYFRAGATYIRLRRLRAFPAAGRLGARLLHTRQIKC